MAEAYLPAELRALGEVLVCLPRKPYNDIGGDVEVGDGLTYPRAYLFELLCCIVPVHVLQGLLSPALKADVHVGG